MATRAVVRLSNRQQAILAALDQALLSELARQYAYVQETLTEDLARITGKIAARAGGGRVGPSWLFQQQRLQSLQAQVVRELTKYGQYAGTLIKAAQRQAVELAAQHSRELMSTLAPNLGVSFATLPTEAVERIVGNTLHDGAPLSNTLRKYPIEASRSIRRALVTSVALGRNPKQTARVLQEELGGVRSNYLRIARTEQLNAYRQASLDTYQANENILEGWEWLLGKYDACAFCQSKTGKVYPLDTPFSSHPMCRCTSVPVRKTPAAIAIASKPTPTGQVPSQTVPMGKPVAASLDLVGKKNAAQWKHAIEQIDRVHGDGALPTVPVKTSSGTRTLGGYRQKVNRYTGEVLERDILISSKSSHIEHTLIHEIGHLLDYEGVNTPGAPAGKSAIAGVRYTAGNITAKLREKLENSAAYKSLQDLSRRHSVTVTGLDAKEYKYAVDPNFVYYLLDPKELWARAYTQYITVRSKDPVLLEQLNLLRKQERVYKSTWDDVDFEPIAAEFDDMFAQLGWIGGQ